MFRRTALEDVGLIATESITEDMHTGLRMHAKGWKSLFVNERLIAAMAAVDITSFNTQRLRWGEGNLGIFAFDNPLTIKGLTLPQRLCYSARCSPGRPACRRLLIYMTPMLMLVSDVPPVNKMTWQLLLITSIYLIVDLDRRKNRLQWIWMAVGHRDDANGVVLDAGSLDMASHIPPRPRNVCRDFQTQPLAEKCRPTADSAGPLYRRQHDRYRLGPDALLPGISDDLIELTVGSALLIGNSYIAWIVIQRALRSKSRRASWRHPVALQVDYRVTNEQGAIACGHCVSRDINESGIASVTFDPLPETGKLYLTIYAAGRSVTCRGTIRSSHKIVHAFSTRSGSTQAYVYGVQFFEPTKEQLAMLWWLGAQYAVGLHYERFTGGQFGLGAMESVSFPAARTSCSSTCLSRLAPTRAMRRSTA